MHLLLISVLAVVAAFAGVQAQNVSPCVINCITQAASSNGCSLTDTKCLCTNTALQQTAIACLQKSCTAQDLQNAESLVNTECASVIGASSIVISSGATSSTAPSGSATSGVSGTATPATSTTPDATTSGAAASQTSNAAIPTALAGVKMGAAAVVAVAVGAVVGL